jgi:Pentapeptide repeats (8 copies)
MALLQRLWLFALAGIVALASGSVVLARPAAKPSSGPPTYPRTMSQPASATIVHVTPSVPAPRRNSQTDAQQRYYEAKARYYDAQANQTLEGKLFWRRLIDNSAAIGATLAAIVALLSFFFNYRATIRNQQDRHFYEALKRIGDRRSPILRGSAVRLVAQIAQITTTLRVTGSRYFEASIDQLTTSLALEDDDAVLQTIQTAITELGRIGPGVVATKLADQNPQLLSRLELALVKFFASYGNRLDKLCDDEFEIENDHDYALMIAQAEHFAGHDVSHLVERMRSREEGTWLRQQLAAETKPALETPIPPTAATNVAEQRDVKVDPAAALTLAARRLNVNMRTLAGTLCERTEGCNLEGSTAELREPEGQSRAAAITAWGAAAKRLWRRLVRPQRRGPLIAQNVYLRGAYLKDARLTGDDFTCADLSKAILLGADLRGTKLFKANLRNANLRNANLRNANLRNADLDGADLEPADLFGADRTGAKLPG